MWIVRISNVNAIGSGNIEVPDSNSIGLSGSARVEIIRENGDIGSRAFNFDTMVTGPNNSSSRGTAKVSILSSENSYETIVQGIGIIARVGVGSYTHSFSISGYTATGAFSVTVEK